MNNPTNSHKKMIPYGNKFKITKHQLQHNLPALLLVGDESWQETAGYELQGYEHFLCLPDMSRAADFKYPVNGYAVTIVILKYPDEIAKRDLETLVKTIAKSGATSVAVRISHSEKLESGAYPVRTFMPSEVSHG